MQNAEIAYAVLWTADMEAAFQRDFNRKSGRPEQTAVHLGPEAVFQMAMEL
jgi:hypothetical protein